MRKAGPVKGNLPLCSELDVDPCEIQKMAEIAADLTSTIGVYVRVDMFVDENKNFSSQEYTTNHMGGCR
ncbi:MAG: hypothetical protein AAGJ35_16335, partial [Myxococcota bacterium]